MKTQELMSHMSMKRRKYHTEGVVSANTLGSGKPRKVVNLGIFEKSTA